MDKVKLIDFWGGKLWLNSWNLTLFLYNRCTWKNPVEHFFPHFKCTQAPLLPNNKHMKNFHFLASYLILKANYFLWTNDKNCNKLKQDAIGGHLVTEGFVGLDGGSQSRSLAPFDIFHIIIVSKVLGFPSFYLNSFERITNYHMQSYWLGVIYKDHWVLLSIFSIQIWLRFQLSVCMVASSITFLFYLILRWWRLVNQKGCSCPWRRNTFQFRDLLSIRFCFHLHQSASFVKWKGR